jgi:hypothetical protein
LLVGDEQPNSFEVIQLDKTAIEITEIIRWDTPAMAVSLLQEALPLNILIARGVEKGR